MDKLGKVDDRIPILQLTRSKSNSKKKPRHKSREVVLKRAQDKTEKQQKHFRVAINQTVINLQICITLKHTYKKNQKTEFLQKKTRTLLSKIQKQITPTFLVPVNNMKHKCKCLQSKEENQIAQEDILED